MKRTAGKQETQKYNIPRKNTNNASNSKIIDKTRKPKSEHKTIQDLGKYVLLNIFKYYVHQDFFKIRRVCYQWNELINETNKKTILCRAVAHSYVSHVLRRGNFRLARNICENIYISKKNNEKDAEYFRNWDKEIIKKLKKRESMIHLILNVLNGGHCECKKVIRSLLEGRIVNNHNLERFKTHLEDILDTMFEFLKKEKLNQGYGLMIPLIFKSIIPMLDEEGMLKIINVFKKYLVDQEKIPLQVMKKEAEEFYQMLQLLSETGNSIVRQQTNILVGMMAVRFSLKNSWYHKDFWDLFFSQSYYKLGIAEYNEINTSIVFDIIKLFQIKNRSLTEYCRSNNVNKFISFLESLLFNEKSSFKYPILCGLNVLLSNPPLMINYEEKDRIHFIFQAYLKKEFENKRICTDGIMSLIWDCKLNEENMRKWLKIAIPNNLNTDECLEIFITRIPEKLIKYLPEEEKIKVIHLFRSNMETNMLRPSLEKAFNVYLDFFCELYVNSSLVVKQQVLLLMGEIVLQCSRVCIKQAWESFFDLIYKDSSLLSYINQAISISEGLLNNKKMNFAERIRESLIKEEENFIECFNENKEIFFEFLKIQFEGIRLNKVKIEVILTLVTIVMSEAIDDDQYRHNVEKWLINNFQNNPNLEAVKMRLKEIDILK